jgi:hypothetical protein
LVQSGGNLLDQSGRARSAKRLFDLHEHFAPTWGKGQAQDNAFTYLVLRLADRASRSATAASASPVASIAAWLDGLKARIAEKQNRIDADHVAKLRALFGSVCVEFNDGRDVLAALLAEPPGAFASALRPRLEGARVDRRAKWTRGEHWARFAVAGNDDRHRGKTSEPVGMSSSRPSAFAASLSSEPNPRARPMSDTSVLSLTDKLSVFASSWRGRAEFLRRRAAEVRARPRADLDTYDAVRDKEAAELEAQAAAWEARAHVADTGYIQVDSNDVRFQMSHAQLIAEAAAAYRVRWIEAVASRSGATR